MSGTAIPPTWRSTPAWQSSSIYSTNVGMDEASASDLDLLNDEANMHILYSHQVHVGGKDEKQCSSSAGIREFGVGRSENIIVHQVAEILVWNALHFQRAAWWHVTNVAVMQPFLAREDSFFDVALLELILQL